MSTHIVEGAFGDLFARIAVLNQLVSHPECSDKAARQQAVKEIADRVWKMREKLGINPRHTGCEMQMAELGYAKYITDPDNPEGKIWIFKGEKNWRDDG